MSLNGLLTNVRWGWDGTELTAAALAGDTVLPVDDAEALSIGDSVFIDEIGNYEVVDSDLELMTVTIDPALPADVEDATPIIPSQGGQPSQVWVAEVVLPDSEEPIEVPLTWNDLLSLREGEYDPPKPIAITNDMTAVVTLPGQFPQVAPAAIDLSGIDFGGPDGEAPGASPAPILIGTIGAILARVVQIANADPVTYQWHISTISNFTPDLTTLLHTGPEASFTIKSLPDGTALQYTTTYYVKVIAQDADGAANASAQASAQMMQITGPDVAVNYVYAGKVAAEQIDSGTMFASLTVSGSIKTAETGARVEIDATGWKQFTSDGVSVVTNFPNDPAQVAFIKNAVMQAKTLTVTDGLEIRGGQGGENIFAPGSRTLLAEGITAPASPLSLAVGWERGRDIPTLYAPPYGVWVDENEASYWYATQFFGGSILRSAAKSYAWPRVLDSTGGYSRATRTMSGLVPLWIGGQERLLLYAGKYFAGYVDPTDIDRVFMLVDPAPMDNSGTIAPTTKWESKIADFDWNISARVGRAFSPVGSTARASWFAYAETSDATSVKTLVLRAYSCTDAGITTQINRAPFSTPFAPGIESITGVTFGSSARMGFVGVDEDIWVVSTTTNNYVYKDAAIPTRQTYRDFPVIPSGFIPFTGGNVANNDFTNFFSKAWAEDQSYRYTNIDWDASTTPIWYGTYTWYDSVGATHESAMAATSQITMLKRASIFVTSPDLPDPAGGKGTVRQPDDVDSFRFYLSRGTPNPTRPAFWAQTLQPAALATSIIVKAPPQFAGTSNPPAVTNFPASAPAVLESNALGTGGLPKIQLTGSGFAHFEALDIAGDGAAALTGKAFEQLYYSIRAQSQLTGGGVKTVDASYNVSWSQRFIMISIGRSPNTALGGFFEIYNPASSAVTNKVLTGNVATLTIGAHKFQIGNLIEVTGVDATYNGTYTITATTATTISYARLSANLVSAAATGAVNVRVLGYGGAPDRSFISGKILLNAWEALWYEPPYKRAGATFTVTNKALTTNVVTLTTAADHALKAGDRVTVAIGDAVFDGYFTVSAVTSNTIQYAKTNANVASAAAAGTIVNDGTATNWDGFRITAQNTTLSVPNNWVLLAIRNADNTIIEFATGENVDPGYDSGIYNIGGQKIKKMNIASGSDTVTGASGICTYAHGLGQTPTQVVVCQGGTGSSQRVSSVSGFTSTAFNVGFRDGATNAVTAAGSAQTIYFLAIAE